jgi:hypothetical protein
MALDILEDHISIDVWQIIYDDGSTARDVFDIFTSIFLTSEIKFRNERNLNFHYKMFPKKLYSNQMDFVSPEMLLSGEVLKKQRESFQEGQRLECYQEANVQIEFLNQQEVERREVRKTVILEQKLKMSVLECNFMESKDAVREILDLLEYHGHGTENEDDDDFVLRSLIQDQNKKEFAQRSKVDHRIRQLKVMVKQVLQRLINGEHLVGNAKHLMTTKIKVINVTSYLSPWKLSNWFTMIDEFLLRSWMTLNIDESFVWKPGIVRYYFP